MLKRSTTTPAADDNAALAYKFWLSRCFCNGSPEEDLLRAVCANSMNSGVIKLRVRSRHPSSERGKRD